MTQPTVTPTALELYARLAQITKDDENNGWVMLLVCDSLVASSLDGMIQISRDSDDGPGWSSLVDLDRCPPTALQWLAQFVGAIAKPGNADNAAYNRDLILNRPGFRRGRPSALISAVKQTLNGAQTVILDERDTSAYHATIHVYSAQMPDEDATLTAIATNKPGSLIIDLDVRDGPTYADIHTELGGVTTYTHRETEFPTYGDIQEFTP